MAETVPIGSETQQAPDLGRFLEAQAPVLEDVLLELRQGHKETHWMWFVFPQLTGLGRSEAARYYTIANSDEAKAYLAHDMLKSRLEECIKAVLSCGESNPARIFGRVDAMKFQSSLTLFALVAPENELFRETLERFYNGKMDDETERLHGE